MFLRTSYILRHKVYSIYVCSVSVGYPGCCYVCAWLAAYALLFNRLNMFLGCFVFLFACQYKSTSNWYDNYCVLRYVRMIITV